MNNKNIIMQGDSYSITISIDFNGKPIDISTVDAIQFVVGDLIKYYKSDGSGEVSYDNDNKYFIFPISQQESFGFNGIVNTQIRVKGIDGSIKGKNGDPICLILSRTKEET